MAQMETLHCRGCGAVLPEKTNATRIKCEYCGTVHQASPEQKLKNTDLVCPRCSTINSQGAQYCSKCGLPLNRTCPKCGTQNRMESVYCTKCGQVMTSAEKASPTPPAAVPGSSGSGRLLLHRDNAWTSRVQRMKVLINGTEACSLAVKETKGLIMNAGVYEVRASFPLSGRSDPYHLEIKPGEEYRLELAASMDLASNGKPKITRG